MKSIFLLPLVLISCTSEEKLAGDSTRPTDDTSYSADTHENLDTADTSDTDTSDTSNGNNWEVMSPGDLIITEIQNNPCVLGDDSDGDGNPDCMLSDDLGEWFEIYNNSSLDLELNGLVIRDDDSNNTQQFTISQSTSISAGGYVVFHVNSDSASNGGISSVVPYNGGDSGFALSNSSDEIIIETPDGTVIDQVFYNDSEFPDTKGYSMTLDPNQFNESSNDSASNWCLATSSYGDGDFGTPGAANDTCQ